MKKTVNTLCQLAANLSAWLHRWVEKKAEHLDDSAWYPSPCQTKFPY